MSEPVHRSRHSLAVGLLTNFADGGLLRALAGLDLSARERPQRLTVGAPNGEHAQRGRDHGNGDPPRSI